LPESPSKSLHHVKAAHLSWGNTQNRTARTAPARDGLEAKFLKQAGGDAKRAASFRKAFYADLAMKSVQARARRRGGEVA
jgi:hypothetical protein